MSNAGGAWDNSKKYIEIEGACGGKGTETHKACVVGDTVGDPFKDTSGPALNILIKLMSMVSLTLAPVIKGNDDWDGWAFGLGPLIIAIVLTVVLFKMDILGWSDPLEGMIGGSSTAQEEANHARTIGLEVDDEATPIVSE